MEWMGNYIEISELVIKVLNEYTSLHKKQILIRDNHTISFSEAQVIEEVLRDKKTILTQLAKELGVTKPAVTKTVTKLEEKGYIQRYKAETNNKNIYVSVTDLGMEIYGTYQKFIYESLFKDLYQLFDKETPETMATFASFFNSADRSLKNIQDKLRS